MTDGNKYSGTSTGNISVSNPSRPISPQETLRKRHQQRPDINPVGKEYPPCKKPSIADSFCAGFDSAGHYIS